MLVAKNRLPMQETQETRIQSMGWEDPLEEGTATHSSTLAWRISWTEETGRLQSIGSQRVGYDWSDLEEHINTQIQLCNSSKHKTEKENYENAHSNQIIQNQWYRENLNRIHVQWHVIYGGTKIQFVDLSLVIIYVKRQWNWFIKYKKSANPDFYIYRIYL